MDGWMVDDDGCLFCFFWLGLACLLAGYVVEQRAQLELWFWGFCCCCFSMAGKRGISIFFAGCLLFLYLLPWFKLSGYGIVVVVLFVAVSRIMCT